MNDENIKFLEERLRLREKQLFLNEKRNKNYLKFFGVLAVFGGSVIAVYFGATGFDVSVKDALEKAREPACLNCEKTGARADKSSSRLSVINSGEIRGGVNLPAEKPAESCAQQCSPSVWIPFTTLILKALFVVAGLGAAAFTVRTVTKSDND